MRAIADAIRDHVLELDHTVHPSTPHDQFIRYIGKNGFDRSRRRFFLPRQDRRLYIAHIVVAVPPPRPHDRLL